MYFWKNDKVRLRMFEQEDSRVLEKHLQDTNSRLQPDHGIALPATRCVAEDMTDYALGCSADEEEYWFAILNPDEKMVGYVVIDWIEERMGNAQFHIVIFEEYKRYGYATAAVNMIFEFLFHERRFHKVACCVLEHNDAGNAFVRSLGMALDGFRSEMFYMHGAYVGEYYYSMIREEFDAGMSKRVSYELPDSDLGKLPEGYLEDGCLVHSVAHPGESRPYFWKYDGIELRDMTEEDYWIKRQMIYDTEACIFFDSDVKLPPISEELTEFEKEHLNFGCEDDRLEFAICDSKGEFVGNINLCGMDKRHGKFSYSVYVLKEHRGKGYATKALRLLLWYCFEELRMHKLICCANHGNDGSAIVMRKAGCRVEGVFRDSEYYHGRYVDSVAFGVTREEFIKFHGFYQ